MFANLNRAGLMAGVSRIPLMADAEPAGVALTVNDLAAIDFDTDDVKGLDDEPPASDKGEPAVDDAPDPDQAPDAVGDGESDDGDDGEPQGVIDPPAMWTEEGKAAFAEASPELQKIILENEKLQNSTVTRAMTEAAEVRKVNSVIMDLAGALDGELQKVQTAFKNDWDGITEEEWDALAVANAPEFKRLRELKRGQEAALSALEAKQKEAVAIAKAQWVDNEANILFTALPELKNPANMNKLIEFAASEGVTPEEMENLGAKFWKILHKTYALSKGQAAKPAIVDPKAAKAAQVPAKPGLRPSLKPGATGKRPAGAMEAFKANPTRDRLADLL